MTSVHSVHKNKGLATQTPENDENGGCHARKDTVCQTPCPEGPKIKKNWSRSKLSISIEIFDLARKFQSRRLDFPTKKRAPVGGSLENFILARNFQSRSKSRDFFWSLGPLGFWTIRGGYRSLSSKTRVLRQIAPESSPERSGKSLSHSFFVVRTVPEGHKHSFFDLWALWVFFHPRQISMLLD